LRRGWSDADIAKLCRTNVLRAFSGVEKAALRLQDSRLPSLKTIDPQVTEPE
jgi:hypothetical protein